MTPPEAPARGAGTLKISDLECIRGDAMVFRRLNFDIHAGEILQVTGGNGSGKTSLLRILSGLARPTAGSVEWNGADIENDRAAWQSSISYLGHLNGATAALSPRENLSYAAALASQPSATNIDEALKRVGLAHLADTPAARLSAGQRQRIALARLVRHPTPIWILDEPLTALDGSAKRLVEDLLAEHIARRGLAVVSTHQSLTTASHAVRQLELNPSQ